MWKSFITSWLCLSVAKFSVTTIWPEIWNGTPRDSFFSTTRNSRKKAGARAAAPTVVEALISVFQDALLSTDISQPIGMLGSAAILPEVMWIAKPTTRSLSLTCKLGMEIERVWRRASWLAFKNKAFRPAKATKPTAKNMNSFRLLFIWHRHGYVHSAYAKCSDQLSESGRGKVNNTSRVRPEWVQRLAICIPRKRAAVIDNHGYRPCYGFAPRVLIGVGHGGRSSPNDRPGHRLRRAERRRRPRGSGCHGRSSCGNQRSARNSPVCRRQGLERGVAAAGGKGPAAAGGLLLAAHRGGHKIFERVAGGFVPFFGERAAARPARQRRGWGTQGLLGGS